jgi:hypothetical protein
MVVNHRLRSLQDDLLRNATDIDTLCQALDGHTLFLRHSIHHADAQAMGSHAEELRGSACEMRDIARTISP